MGLPFHLDQPLPSLPVDPACWVEPRARAAGDQRDRVLEIQRCLGDAVAAGPPPPHRSAPLRVVPGDCVAALGTLSGLQRRGVDPAIVWFDAHGEFNTPATTRSGYLGGMPLAVATGRDPARIGPHLGLLPVPDARVLLVGAPDLDPEEAELLAARAVRRTSAGGLSSDTLPSGPLHLHLDVDVADPADLPGLRCPAPGGPPLADVAAAVGVVLGTGRVVAFSVACTWVPAAGAAAAGARAAVRRTGWMDPALAVPGPDG